MDFRYLLYKKQIIVQFYWEVKGSNPFYNMLRGSRQRLLFSRIP